METYQIIGVITLSVLVMIVLLDGLSINYTWKNIKVGDIAYVTKDCDGLHTTYGYAEVIAKTDDYITIALSNDKHMGVKKHDYLHGDIHLKWYKINGMEVYKI